MKSTQCRNVEAKGHELGRIKLDLVRLELLLPAIEACHDAGVHRVACPVLRVRQELLNSLST